MLRHLPSLLLAAPALAIPATTTLALVENDPVFNKLRITVDPQIPLVDLSDTEVTTLTGSVTAAFDVDPLRHQTSTMTLSDGRAHATPVTFSRSVLFGTYSYTVTASGLSAAVYTLIPPGAVDPPTGNFDASQHAFSLDSGSLTGVALGNPIDIGLTPEEPLAGAGNGIGQVTLTPSGTTALHQLYDVVVTLPIATSDAFEAGGTSVNVTSTGILKAAGTLEVPRSEYLAWTIREGIPGANPAADVNGDGLPNAFAWACNLGGNEDGGAWRPVALPDGGFEIRVPAVGTVAPVRVRVTNNLGNWTDLPAGRLSGGQNPLPVGSSGTRTVTPSGGPREFLRLEVEE
jgi:hypothetical protein